MPHSDGWMVLLEKTDEMQDGSGDPSCDPINNAAPPPPACRQQLAEVDHSVTFQPSENDEYSCCLHIKNLAPCFIIFKIKTTSPDNYRVNPTIAAIQCGATATVSIRSLGGVSAEQILRDRFLVQACILPEGALKDEDGDDSDDSELDARNAHFADLNNTFKRLISSSVATVNSFRVAACVEPRPAPYDGHPSSCLSEQTFRKGLADLEKKITGPLKDNWTRSNAYRMMAVLFFGIFVGVLLAPRLLGITCKVPEDFCKIGCPDYIHKSECGAGGTCSGNSSSWLPF